MAHSLTVSTPLGSYPVLIERGLLQRSSLPWPEGCVPERVQVISETNVTRHHGRLWEERGFSPLVFEAGEASKHLGTVQALYDGLLERGAARDCTILGFGGGVVGDTAGFVASSFLRGVGFVQVPTSLLAMVDASVGGKTGVNLPQGKNLVGAFYHPQAVWIDPDVLKTLPAREFRSGLAEVIKYGLLSDPVLLTSAALQKEQVEDMIARSLKVKAELVSEDPNERGKRAYLNLGHTFGHGIELLSEYGWSHGEAVAVGMVMACRLSVRLGWLSQGDVRALEQLLETVGLPTRLKEVLRPGEASRLWEAMQTDKKKKGGALRFVLLQAPQRPVVTAEAPMSLVLEAIEDVLEAA
jgi:3-dehydroquinate synthase